MEGPGRSTHLAAETQLCPSGTWKHPGTAQPVYTELGSAYRGISTPALSVLRLLQVGSPALWHLWHLCPAQRLERDALLAFPF